MTIERLAELYVRGLYSKLDFYSWLLDTLSRTDDADYVMERVPEIVLGDVLDMAQRHYDSAGEASSFEEQKNPEKILRWRDRRAELLTAGRADGNGTDAAPGQGQALPDPNVPRSASR